MAVKLTLGDIKYQLPERFTVTQWESLLKYDFETYRDWSKILGTALDAKPEEFELATIESMTLAISFIIALMNQRTETVVIDFNEISFGQFVDLDIYIVQGVEKNIKPILDILNSKTYWSDEAMWLIEQYQKFRVHTYRAYSGLFGLNDPKGDDEEDLENIDPNKIAKGWYRIIADLADNDVLKMDAVTDEPLKKILNFMSLRKELQLEENFKQLQQKRKHDVSRNRK
jgi:hypothetical protein